MGASRSAAEAATLVSESVAFMFPFVELPVSAEVRGCRRGPNVGETRMRALIDKRNGRTFPAGMAGGRRQMTDGRQLPRRGAEGAKIRAGAASGFVCFFAPLPLFANPPIRDSSTTDGFGQRPNRLPAASANGLGGWTGPANGGLGLVHSSSAISGRLRSQAAGDQPEAARTRFGRWPNPISGST